MIFMEIPDFTFRSIDYAVRTEEDRHKRNILQ